MSTSPNNPGKPRRAARRRLITVALSIAAHVGVGFAIVTAQVGPPRSLEPEPMIVELVQPPPRLAFVVTPVKTVEPKPEPPKPAKPPPRLPRFRPTPLPPPPDVPPLPAGKAVVAVQASDGPTDGELANATTAESTPAGRPCNMPRWLQAALRKDPLVQSAVANAHRGQAIMVWNGDWVRHRDQEGAGLAAVREAIMWEVAFAPEACRKEPVRGLVLISLGDAPGSARLVVGADRWRWSDMLFVRAGAVVSTR